MASCGAASLENRAGDPLARLPWYWVLLFCAALLAGPAYSMFFQYEADHRQNGTFFHGMTDCGSYLQMAEGNFDVIVTHKYRVVVPLLARTVALPVDGIFRAVWPNRDNSAARLCFAFFLVNFTLMSLTGLVLFRLCQAYGLSGLASAVAVTGLLSSRWAIYMAAVPMVDSFHWLCVSLVFLAIKAKNGRLLALAMLLGPLSRESFVFIAPATLMFGHLRLSTQFILYALAGLLVLAVHYFIDLSFPATGVGSVANAVDHLGNIAISLRRMLSVAGLGDIVSLVGLFNIIWIVALFQPDGRRALRTVDGPLLFLLASVIFQALISTSIPRMLYTSAPFWAVLIGQAFQHWYERLSGSNMPDAKGLTPVDGLTNPARAA